MGLKRKSGCYVIWHYSFQYRKESRGMYQIKSNLSLRGPFPRRCARAAQLLSKKSRSGGEPLATLCPIWPARDLNLRPPTPETNALPLDQLLIEKELQKDLLYLACRHQILKLLAQTAFSTTMGSTAAPEVLLFTRFQAQWKFIGKTLFATIVTNKDFAGIVFDESLIA